MRRLHTEVPPDVLRSSGSRVRLPVMTTRLMFVAAISWRSFSLYERFGRGQARVHVTTAGMSARAREVAGMSARIRGVVTKRARMSSGGRLGALGRALDVLGRTLRCGAGLTLGLVRGALRVRRGARRDARVLRSL